MSIEPQTWRVVVDRVEQSEAFIPMTPRCLETLRKFQEGPTEEERVSIRLAAAEREAKRRAETYALESRHSELRAHYPEGVVADLLFHHRPQADRGSPGWLECRGCPSYYDYDPFGDGSEQHHAWPCPTWQTISDSVGGENGDK